MRCLETARILVITLVLCALIALAIVLATLHTVDLMSASAGAIRNAPGHDEPTELTRQPGDALSTPAAGLAWPSELMRGSARPLVVRRIATPHNSLAPGQEGNVEMTHPNSGDDRYTTGEGSGPGLGHDQPLPAHLVGAVEDAFRRLQAGDVQMIGLPVPAMPHTAPTR